MMKAKFTMPDGSDVLLIGLSHGNLDRLRADGLRGYIRIDGASVGIGVDILITAAESERVMMEAFNDLIGPNTKLHIDKKLRS